MRKNNIYKYISIILCAALLTGCGIRKVEYGDGESNTENKGSDSAGTKLAGKLAESIHAETELHADWQCQTKEGDDFFIKVNAEVSVPDTDSMQIVRVTPKRYSADEKKKIAERLFDAESIRMLGNGGFETKEEIGRLIEDFDSIYTRDYSHMGSFEASAYRAELLMTAGGKGKEYLQDLYDHFEEVAKNDYSENIYKGTVKGKPYVLQFETKWDKAAYSEPCIAFYPDADAEFEIAGETVGNNYSYGSLPPDSDEFGANKAKMTREEATETAQRLCDELGIEGLFVDEIYNLGWATYEEEIDETIGCKRFDKKECNGYMVVMRRGINGCSVFRDKIWSAGFDAAKDSDSNLRPELLALYLTDDGLVELEYQQPLKMGEVLTEQTKLLDYSYIPELLKSFATESNSENDCGDNIFYNSLELTYLCVRDGKDKSSYYLLPVWCMYQKNDSFDVEPYSFYSPFYDEGASGFAVNAVDGSLIDMESMTD